MSGPRARPASRRSSYASRRTPAATACSAPARPDREDARGDRSARASVEEIHQSVHYALDLLRRSLDLHTAVLLWLNDAGTHLRISELSTASDDIQRRPLRRRRRRARRGAGTAGPRLAPRTQALVQGARTTRAHAPCARSRPSRCSKARRCAASSPSTASATTPSRRTRRRSIDAGRSLLPARHPERARLPAARARQGRAGQALPRGAGARRRAQREGRGRRRRAGRARDRELRPGRRDRLRRGRRARTRSWPPRARTARSTISSACASRTTRGSSRWSCRTAARSPYRGEYDAGRQVVLSKRLPWPSLPSLLVLPLLMHDRAARHAHPRREAAPRVRRRGPAHARGARQPPGREPVERPHGPQARDDGDDRRPDRPPQQARHARGRRAEDRRRRALRPPARRR